MSVKPFYSPDQITRDAAARTDAVIVGFSRGKESLACMEVCCRLRDAGLFKTVHAYHMHIVPGLQFVERSLQYYERRFKVNVLRLPYWVSDVLYSRGDYGPHEWAAADKITRQIKINDIEAYVRKQTGADWLCYGHKKRDSLERNGMLATFHMHGVDVKGRRFYPLAHLNNAATLSILKTKNIPLPPDYSLFRFGRGESMADMTAECLRAIRDRYPEDYATIIRLHPYVESNIKREEWYGKKERKGPWRGFKAEWLDGDGGGRGCDGGSGGAPPATEQA